MTDDFRDGLKPRDLAAMVIAERNLLSAVIGDNAGKLTVFVLASEALELRERVAEAETAMRHLANAKHSISDAARIVRAYFAKHGA